MQPAASEPEEIRAAAGLPGNDFGGYVIVRPLGHGSSGVVYLAWQKSLGRYVALKLLHRRFGVDVQRFAREAHILARLEHPNIVPIHDVGEHDGTPYLAMKYVAGRPLGAEPLALPRALAVMRDVADAVEHAHASGIVHRDLKPANVMLGEDGHVYVMDFGIARHLEGGATLTVPGRIAGSPAYMPPEQATGARCDARSDVYALGATLYELCTGRPPFSGASAVDVLAQVLRHEPPPPRRLAPTLPAEIDAIVGKAMEKKAERRYPSARAFADDLRRQLAGEPIHARPPGPLARALKWIGRHPIVSAALAVAIAALALMLAGTALYVADVTRARASAEHERRVAEWKLADSLVSQADALSLGARWPEAEERYAEAFAIYTRMGLSPAAADLGMLGVLRHAPPALQIYLGQTDRVASLAFLPDGRSFVSASADRTLKLWDVATGTAIRTFNGHGHGVWTLALAADGRSLVSGSRDGSIRIWDLASGNTVRALKRDGSRVHAVALAGDLLLSGHDDGSVTVWDATTGALLRKLEGHLERVRALAVAPLPAGSRHGPAGAPLVASASWDGTVKLWEPRAGRLLATLGDHAGDVFTVALAPDARRLYAAGTGNVVQIWDVERGALEAELRGHTATICQLALTADGQGVLSASWDGTVRRWDVARRTGTVVARHGSRVYAVAPSPDGRRVLASGEGGVINLWSLAPATSTSLALDAGASNDLRTVALSPDGRLVATGSSAGTAAIYDVATGLRLRAFAGHTARVTSVAFAGAALVSASEDGSAAVWDVASGRLRARWPAGAPINTVAVAPDGGELLLATAESSGLWTLGGERRHVLPGRARSGVYRPDGAQVVTTSNEGLLRVWDRATGRELASLRGHDGAVIAVAIAPDGNLLASGSTDNTIRLWDLAGRRELRRLLGHAGQIRAVAFAPDGRLLASGSEDHSVRLWDVATGRETRSFTAYAGRVSALAFAPDGGALYTASQAEALTVLGFGLAAEYRAHAARLGDARAALAVRPQDPSALAALGRWFAFRDACDLALPLLERGRVAGAPISDLTLARCYFKVGDRARAEVALDRARASGIAPAAYLALFLDPAP